MIEGLERLVNLEELYLSYNGIEEMQGLDTLVRMTRWRSQWGGGGICNRQWSLYGANVGNFWKGFLCVAWLFSFVESSGLILMKTHYWLIISCVKLCMFGLHLEFE